MYKKRERGKNYTEIEKNSLLDIVGEFLNIIENKKTDDKNAKKKKDTWDVISHRYDAVQQTGLRSGTQLKLLYENIKQKAKKDKADEKVEIYKTGGGAPSIKIDTISEKCLSMTENTISDISNIYDSSAMADISSENEIILEVNNDLHIEKYSPIPTTSGIKNFTESTSTKKKRHFSQKNNKIELKKRSSQKEDIKLEIMEIKLEKEKILRDILLLEKEEKILEVKEKRMKLKIFKRKEGLSDSE